MTVKDKVHIYLAGPLFAIGDRRRNARLAEHMRKRGCTVIVPQVEAKKFETPEGLDLPAMAEHCRQCAKDPNSVLVACLDGPEADSGTAVEYGIAMEATGRAVCYRTDFRTSLQHEVGVNAMFRLAGSEMLFLPLYGTTVAECESDLERLAIAILATVQKVLNR